MKTKTTADNGKKTSCIRNHRQVYKALLGLANMFNPNDPALVEKGVTRKQLSEKRYRIETETLGGILHVHIESHDVSIHYNMVVKNENAL